MARLGTGTSFCIYATKLQSFDNWMNYSYSSSSYTRYGFDDMPLYGNNPKSDRVNYQPTINVYQDHGLPRITRSLLLG